MPLLFFALWAVPGLAATYHVDELGDDLDDGSAGTPWATLQHAADTVVAGDTVVVHPGNHAGFYLSTSGTAVDPITFRGQPGAIVDTDNGTTPDVINLEGASHVVLEGLEVTGATRAGIRVVLADGVVVRGNHTHDNGRWGIFTGFCDDITIEGNETARAGIEHGIYFSNSGDRPIIRGNHSYDNHANGIHMNGDQSAGGDGIISGAVVEDNVIHGNGVGGGSGINCDGVQDSVIQNNLLYDNHASGISLYRIDGAQGSRGNIVANNTVLQASDGRWAVNLQNGATDTTLVNNLLWTDHSFRGVIDISASSLSGLSSDHNAVVERFTTDGGNSVLDLAGWRSATGQDTHSLAITALAEVFEDAALDDYHLSATSVAIDQGTATDAPTDDLEGKPRPIGAGHDIGAYEWGEADADTDTDADADSDTDTDADSDADVPPASEDDKDGGCGCQTGPTPSLGWLWLPVLGGWLRRRTVRLG